MNTCQGKKPRRKCMRYLKVIFRILPKDIKEDVIKCKIISVLKWKTVS